MILIGIIVAIVVAYIASASWAFGYVRGLMNDRENGWETPMPILAAVLWPLTLLLIVLSGIINPAHRMGFAFQQADLERKKKRIALQEKVRIDLQKADKEIAAIEKELDAELRSRDEEQLKPSKGRTVGR